MLRRGSDEHDGADDVLGRDLAGAAPVEHLDDRALDPSAPEPLRRPVPTPGRRAPRPCAAYDVAGRSRTPPGRRRSLAEADGNRTRLTGMPGHYGFEDRARHQTRYASAVNLVLVETPRKRRAPGLGFAVRFGQSGYRSPSNGGGGGHRQAHRVVAAAATAAPAATSSVAARPRSRRAAATSTPRTVDADKVVSSICPFCAVGCAQKVFVKDGQVTQIEGDPGQPDLARAAVPQGQRQQAAGHLAHPGDQGALPATPRHRVGGPRPRHRDGHDRRPRHQDPQGVLGVGGRRQAAPAARSASPASEERPSTTRRTTS